MISRLPLILIIFISVLAISCSSTDDLVPLPMYEFIEENDIEGSSAIINFENIQVITLSRDAYKLNLTFF